MSALDLPTVRDRLAALLPGLRDRYGLGGLSVFGSFARGEATTDSDLDLLVAFDRTPTLYALGGLTLDLKDALGVEVHLAVEPVRDPELSAAIERERVPVG